MSLILRDNTSVSNNSVVLSNTWISDETCRIFQYIVYVFACQSISVFGIGANIVNIICFIKQGFQDSVNVNFLGLAISDMGCLITTFALSVGYNPSFQSMDKPLDLIELMYLTAGWPHMAFARVTSYITALITLERCLCIIIPIKVKSVFTPRRVFGMHLIICGFVTCGVAPVYCVNWYTWKFSPGKNTTVLVLDYMPGKENIEFVAYAFNMASPFIAFVIIIICTTTLVMKLQNKSKWRMKSVVSSQALEIANREHKVAKMVVALSILFISCYFPICLAFIALMFIPGADIGGNNVNISIIFAGIGILLESVNSSMNLFVYYSMSSKYRAVLLKLLTLQ